MWVLYMLPGSFGVHEGGGFARVVVCFIWVFMRDVKVSCGLFTWFVRLLPVFTSTGISVLHLRARQASTA